MCGATPGRITRAFFQFKLRGTFARVFLSGIATGSTKSFPKFSFGRRGVQHNDNHRQLAISSYDAPLQSLRIPAGWKIEYNSLFEIDPLPDLIPPDHHSWFFKEDMLQMKHKA
jgi:hypothetical protein